MTKQELMETYTAEQLAEMVEKLQEQVDALQGILTEKERKTKNNIISVVVGGIVKEYQIEEIGDIVRAYEEIKLCEEMNKECKTILPSEYLKVLSLNQMVSELQSEVEKYRKAFEDTKKERDCKISEYRKKIEKLTAENEKLKGNVGSDGYCDKQNKTNNFYGIYAHSAKNLTKDDLLMFLGILTKELIKNGIDFRYEMEKELKVWDIKIESDKEITDFFPTEPIKVADMLINAEGEYEHNAIAKALYKEDKGTYRIFDISELRQIAEHLLIYCNHNKEVEE